MEDQQDSAHLDFQGIWKTSRCLNICEVENELRIPFMHSEASGSNKPHLQMAYAHAKRFAKFGEQERQQLRAALEDWEAPHGSNENRKSESDMSQSRLAPFELAQLVNLVPNDVDEAVSLIPSLERFSPVDLSSVLDTIANYMRQSTTGQTQISY